MNRHTLLTLRRPLAHAAGLIAAAALAACASTTPPAADAALAAASSQAPQTTPAVQAAPATSASATPSADIAFGAVDTDFAAQVRPSPMVVHAGDRVQLNGSQFKPGQVVTLSYAGQALAAPVTADAQGRFSVPLHIPEQAQSGRHPIALSAANPNAASVVTLKISPKLAPMGQERFALQSHKLASGSLYQSAYSHKNNTLFVTRAAGRPPVSESQLFKLDADSLQVLAHITPAEAPQRQDRQGQMQPGGVFAVYGVGVDDVRDTVWVTNTRQNTVAVYRQSDLRLIRQLPPESAQHARDVVVDARRGKAFVSTVSPQIEVFDTRSLKKVDTITIASSLRGPNARPFAVMSLALDATAGKLAAVSSTAEVALIDTRTRKVEKVFAIAGVNASSGIAYDAGRKRLYVASQGSDDLAIVDAETGRLLHRVPVGAGALNVALEPSSGLAYVANRGANTVAVVSPEGQLLGNLPTGPQPNHLSVGASGLYLVNAGPQDNPASGHVTHLRTR